MTEAQYQKMLWKCAAYDGLVATAEKEVQECIEDLDYCMWIYFGTSFRMDWWALDYYTDVKSRTKEYDKTYRKYITLCKKGDVLRRSSQLAITKYHKKTQFNTPN